MSLHEQLKAAVEERKRITEAAMYPEPEFSPNALPYRPEHWNDPSVEMFEFLRITHPARVLRGCVRDLRVLERHCESEEFGPGWCFWCSEDLGTTVVQVSYPCPEIKDLAYAYGLLPVEAH